MIIALFDIIQALKKHTLKVLKISSMLRGDRTLRSSSSSRMKSLNLENSLDSSFST